MNKISIKTEYIKLDQFLKWAGVADSGATAKFFISEGNIKVNGVVTLERGKKLHRGDIIEVKELSVFEIV